MPNKDYPVVALNRFIEATRDSGYKTTASAVAELIDNAFQAKASKVDVSILETTVNSARNLTVIIKDNGSGMPPSVLRLALQFGGSTRFNSRTGVGRYGMGLPNSSLSQARRVDVYSWTSPSRVYWSYLDVDGIAAGTIVCVPKPKPRKARDGLSADTKSGTIVRWTQCDRLKHKRAKTIAARLAVELGRTFRRQILAGKVIKINGNTVPSYDPLFVREGANLAGASLYGPPLQYHIQVPENFLAAGSSTVTVTFSALPIAKWHSLSNEEKRIHGISKGACVSIVRAGREIDYGWFFMGAKRKENYDDWWRCEIAFDAPLDELFGVTHTKQGIHPTEELIGILAPDLERIAHELNANVRLTFSQLKIADNSSVARNVAESRDYLLEPPKRRNATMPRLVMGKEALACDLKLSLPGLSYRIEHRFLKEASFYVPQVNNRELLLTLNEDHPFYDKIYSSLTNHEFVNISAARHFIEILLFAVARAECTFSANGQRDYAHNLRESWSNTLAAFLG
jgi:hypothetical protein